jgi:large subunit ribosomal protein L14
MLQTLSRVKVADNSGAKEISIIRNLGGSVRKFSGINDIVIASVKVASSTAIVKKGKVVRALIIRTLKGIKNEYGISLKFQKNCAVLLKEDNSLIGTNIFGMTPEKILPNYFKKLQINKK